MDKIRGQVLKRTLPSLVFSQNLIWEYSRYNAEMSFAVTRILNSETDIALYDARKAQQSPVLPKDITELMLRGMSLLKAVRVSQGKTQMYVADFKMNISQAFLSDLESGKRKGTPETLAKLAQIYNVPKEWFL